MPISRPRTRFLDDVVAELRAMAPAPKTVEPAFRDPTAMNDDEVPAVFMELASGGSRRPEVGIGVRWEMPWDLWGIVKSAQTGEGRQKEREELHGRVMNAMLDSSKLQVRLDLTLSQNGQIGVTEVRDDGPPVVDEGLPVGSPYGIFRQPMIAVLHWDRGAL